MPCPPLRLHHPYNVPINGRTLEKTKLCSANTCLFQISLLTSNREAIEIKKSSEAVNKVMSTGFIQITTLFTTTIWKLLYEIPTFMINYGVILNIYFYWVFEISVMRNLQFVKRYLKARESTIKHVQNQNWSSFPHLSVDSSRVQEHWNDATSINHLESSDFTKLLQVTALSPQRTNIFYPF